MLTPQSALWHVGVTSFWPVGLTAVRIECNLAGLLSEVKLHALTEVWLGGLTTAGFNNSG